jgi:hypothetical protein
VQRAFRHIINTNIGGHIKLIKHRQSCLSQFTEHKALKKSCIRTTYHYVEYLCASFSLLLMHIFLSLKCLITQGWIGVPQWKRLKVQDDNSVTSLKS